MNRARALGLALILGVVMAPAGAADPPAPLPDYADSTFVPVVVTPAPTDPGVVAALPRALTRPALAPTAHPRAPTPEPSVSKARVGSVFGVATWYCWPGHSICTNGFDAAGAYGAAGPALRAALGPGWRGRTVYVNGVAVRLIDWCACGGRHVIDVYYATWRTIPNPSAVTITW